MQRRHQTSQRKSALLLSYVLLLQCLLVDSRGCRYEDWIDTSKCTHACGEGQKAQARARWPSDTATESCNKEVLRIVKCENPCCWYDDWIDTSPCSVSCGRGIKSQARAKWPSTNDTDHEPCDKEVLRIAKCKEECTTSTATPTTPQPNKSPIGVLNPVLVPHIPQIDPETIKTGVQIATVGAGAVGAAALAVSILETLPFLLIGKRDTAVQNIDPKRRLNAYISKFQTGRKTRSLK